MIGTGKYDFPGIRKAATVAINLALAATGWGAWLLASPFRPLVLKIEEWAAEWLANRGLLILNLGAFYVEGVLDQAAFDQAMDEGLEKIKIPGLSEEEKWAIDEKVVQAMRNFGRITRNN